MIPDAEWVRWGGLAVLAAAAAHDAVTGRLPTAAALVAGVLGLLAAALDGGVSGLTIAVFLAAAWFAGLFAVNEASFRLFGTESFGGGDIKWTAAAAACFGFSAAAAAWLIGAVFASAWLLGHRAVGVPKATVKFGPFLLLGLAAFVARIPVLTALLPPSL